jgi:hypothetical protein
MPAKHSRAAFFEPNHFFEPAGHRIQVYRWSSMIVFYAEYRILDKLTLVRIA